jgi:hypothetical protein
MTKAGATASVALFGLQKPTAWQLCYHLSQAAILAYFLTAINIR